MNGCATAWRSEEVERLAKERAIRRMIDLPDNMLKYWRFRHSLFDKFNEGIMLDEESWFSVTPEALAYRLAVECKTNVIMDGFCGTSGMLAKRLQAGLVWQA